MLSLFQNSKVHRNALLKALGEAYVTHIISIDEIDQLVGNITAGACIAFTDEEIPPKGRDSTKALHITIKCKSHVMSRAFLDNGSSLNVMPMSTLSRLPIDLSYIKKVKWWSELSMGQKKSSQKHQASYSSRALYF